MSVDRRELAAIFLGGCLGAILRAFLIEVVPPSEGEWPWATLIVNLVGALALGYFATRLQERLPLSAYRRPLLGTGLCGALTTFSTMQLELVRMLEADQLRLACSYAFVSVTLGFIAILFASNLVRRARWSR
jgi:fluoride exporter